MHARIGQKWGGGLYAGSLHFRVTTITDRRMPRGRAISALSLAVWWAKLEKNDKVRHNMTQIASLLAVATVFVDLCAPFYSQGGGGGLIHRRRNIFEVRGAKQYLRANFLTAPTFRSNHAHFASTRLCDSEARGFLAMERAVSQAEHTL